MPHNNTLIHLVWATKGRNPLINQDIRPNLLDHIRSNAKEKGIFIDYINCHYDHVHCLISLRVDQNISTVVKLIKGESSHWINQQKIIPKKFAWQYEYFAVSVSESGKERVRCYIRNQDEHHRKKTFQDEYDEFFKRFNFLDPSSPPSKLLTLPAPDRSYPLY